MSTLEAIPGDPRPSRAAPLPAAVPLPIAPPAAPEPSILASQTIRAGRLDACLACPQLRENGYCHAGQWFVRIRAKLAAGKCPLKRWPVGATSAPAG